ncbi:MAG TPA: TonB-dependent siderophore receptor [Terracidiphilus sp.]
MQLFVLAKISLPFALHRSWLRALVVCCLLALPLTLAAQTDTAPPKKPAPLPTVTTTVVVHGGVRDDFAPNTIEAGSLDGLPLKESPLSVTAVTRAVLDDQGARVLTDVVKNDASVGEDYAPVGYYGSFQIRGFPIDLATAMQMNGLSIAGEQDVPLEGVERVEILKGIAGLESGIASSGGLINYVTKDPVEGLHPTIDVASDHRGTAYSALDVTRNFRARWTPAVRVNVAGESMRSYVEHADGWRGAGAGDGVLHLDANTTAFIDFDYQHKVQRSEAGYQLLGGTTIPSPVFASTMLGYQPWSKPNTFDTFNAGARLQHAFNARWTARVAGSYSHSLIDDNVIWPYGSALDGAGSSLCPDSPYYFFCPDGSYEVYDYRSPGELRINASGEALAQGHFATGKVTHDVVAGGSLFHRSVALSSSTVYTPLGVENLYEPNVIFTQDEDQAGPSALADSNRQLSAIVQERMHLPGGVALQAGGRFVRIGDYNYTSARTEWLPQYAATYAPLAALTFYANYGVLLSLGPQAPWWVDNSAVFLEPFHTRQAEVGAKFEPTQRMLVTAALFRMRQPFFYPHVIDAPDDFCAADVFYGPGDLCFETAGRETHNGAELNVQGKAARWLQLTASGTAMQATAADTGTAAYDGKQVLNVPRVHTSLFADVAVPHIAGLHVMPGWSYTGRKAATRDDLVSVDGYNLLNLGVRYEPRGEAGRVTLRLYADNVLNKRYWKDTGASYGDTFIHQGAPATMRISARYRF